VSLYRRDVVAAQLRERNTLDLRRSAHRGRASRRAAPAARRPAAVPSGRRGGRPSRRSSTRRRS
jgi:hypothetical protein